jgi:hypothetical protein
MGSISKYNRCFKHNLGSSIGHRLSKEITTYKMTILKGLHQLLRDNLIKAHFTSSLKQWTSISGKINRT